MPLSYRLLYPVKGLNLTTAYLAEVHFPGKAAILNSDIDHRTVGVVFAAPFALWHYSSPTRVASLEISLKFLGHVAAEEL